MNIWENTSSREHSMYKGPVARSCLTCSKKGQEASIAGWKGTGRKLGEEVSKVVSDQVTEGLMEHGKSF